MATLAILWSQIQAIVSLSSSKGLHKHCNDLPFLREKMKLGRLKNFVIILHDKTEYVARIQILEASANHELVFKKANKLNFILSRSLFKTIR